jgi:hypothetical protein
MEKRRIGNEGKEGGGSEGREEREEEGEAEDQYHIQRFESSRSKS